MRLLVVLLLVVSSTVVFAQKKKKDKEPAQPAATQQQSTQPVPQPQAAQPAPDTTAVPSASMILTEHYLRKYSAAARWNDPAVAKEALYDIIVENPDNDSLIYSLAYYYYEEQQYASALLIAQDLLTRQPKDQSYLEIAGSAAQLLGANEKALQHFETLYLLNTNIRTLYQVAFLQYQMKRYAESTTSVSILLGKTEVTTEKVVFNDAKGNPKEYPLKVSVLNLKGLLALDQNDKAGAKKAFTEALALAPDFIPAKENMEKTK